jgi:thiol-disulfide isomerase/thioredoxin
MNGPTEGKTSVPQNSPKGPFLAAVALLVVGGMALLLLGNPRTAPETTSQPAPNFVLSDIDGNRLELSALRGKPVLLYFSASWCLPCRADTRQLAQLYEQYRDRFQVVWISFDQFADSNQDLREHRRLYGHPDFRYALDARTSPVIQLYRVQARGSIVLINSRGEIVFRGIRSLDNPRFREQLHQELGKG